MTKINLLPWREDLRKKKQKDFINAGVLVALIGILSVVLAHSYIEQLKIYQNQRNQLLQNEITLLDKKIVEIKDIEAKKKQLQTKIKLIEQLQESRHQAVHLLDEISKIMPEGVFLTKLTQSGHELTFEGKSESNAQISALMRAIEASLWLQKPTLLVIKLPDKTPNNKIGTESLSDFNLHALQGKQKNITAIGTVNESIKN
ncbi:MAG: pilus assembly protein PilN [Methylococcales bacterium]|nr:MAG: pilus assembly protein PilN [Methylococcales bacterium]